mgnify:CR=1 FL=1
MQVSIDTKDIDELTGRPTRLVLTAKNGIDEIFLQRVLNAMNSEDVELSSVAFLLSDLRVIYFADQKGPSFENVIAAANAWASHQRNLQNEDRDEIEPSQGDQA